MMAMLLGLMLLTMIAPVLAQTPPAPSAADIAKFDQVLQPVWKIYNMIKYIATAIALVVLLFAGIKYMMSGSNAADRDSAKNMVAYVIIGLVVIWVAPLVVQLFTS
jgi:type IV secretory pathway VirB2 component (pilin)